MISWLKAIGIAFVAVCGAVVVVTALAWGLERLVSHAVAQLIILALMIAFVAHDIHGRFVKPDRHPGAGRGAGEQS